MSDNDKLWPWLLGGILVSLIYRYLFSEPWINSFLGGAFFGYPVGLVIFFICDVIKETIIFIFLTIPEHGINIIKQYLHLKNKKQIIKGRMIEREKEDELHQKKIAALFVSDLWRFVGMISNETHKEKMARHITNHLSGVDEATKYLVKNNKEFKNQIRLILKELKKHGMRNETCYTHLTTFV